MARSPPTPRACSTAYGDGGVNVFNNAGTFTKQGPGDVHFRTNITGVAFNNTGTVDVQAGMLSSSSGGTHTGDFTVAAGATLCAQRNPQLCRCG